MILDNYNQFLDKIMQKIGELGIDVSKLNLDHIGYQAESNEDYDNLKTQFAEIGVEMPESIVGGRRVAVYELKTPLKYKQYIIPAIELVAPKEGQVCLSVLEHAEFVIDEDFESFTNRYPDLSWDKSKVNQPKFPMVTLKLDDNLQVKFHYKPVLEIVKQK